MNKLEEWKNKKRDFNKELKVLKNKKEFIYLIKINYNIKQLIEEMENYINNIKELLIDENDLVIFDFDLIEKDNLNDFTFGKNVFPLLVIKEKNKPVEFVEGIRNFNS